MIHDHGFDLHPLDDDHLPRGSFLTLFWHLTFSLEYLARDRPQHKMGRIYRLYAYRSLSVTSVWPSESSVGAFRAYEWPNGRFPGTVGVCLNPRWVFFIQIFYTTC